MFEKQFWMAGIMPSFSALRLAGRLRPTVITAPDISTLSSAEGSAFAAGAAFPMSNYVLCRIVIYYNEFTRSQQGAIRTPPGQIINFCRKTCRTGSGTDQFC